MHRENLLELSFGLKRNNQMEHTMETTSLTSTSPISPAVKMAQEIAKKVEPSKFDTIISVGVTYEEGGRWHNVDLNFREYLKLLQTGELDEKKVCAVEVSLTNCENAEGDKIRMVYDFVHLHTERNPWRML